MTGETAADRTGPDLDALRVALAAAGVDVNRYADDLPLVAFVLERSQDGFAELARFPVGDQPPEIPLDPSRPPHREDR